MSVESHFWLEQEILVSKREAGGSGQSVPREGHHYVCLSPHSIECVRRSLRKYRSTRTSDGVFTVSVAVFCGMALQALHAYDSDPDIDDHVLNPVTSPHHLPETLLEDEVRELVAELIDRVCNSITEQKVVSLVPDFRASVNENEIDIDSDSSSSSSDWSLSSDADSDDPDAGNEPAFRPVRTKGELGLDELPPIQRLDISADVEQLSHMGRVAGIVDRLVTVVSFKSLPPLDLDSVLFTKDGHALGPIFDVFGPVKEPRYVLRFNSQQEIADNQIEVDMPVYYAPNLPFTSYVFTSHLMTMRGSDASWKHDNEPPDEIKEYSDDEEERRDRVRNQKNKRKIFS